MEAYEKATGESCNWARKTNVVFLGIGNWFHWRSPLYQIFKGSICSLGPSETY